MTTPMLIVTLLIDASTILLLFALVDVVRGVRSRRILLDLLHFALNFLRPRGRHRELNRPA